MNYMLALVAVPLSIVYIVPLIHKSRLDPPTALFWPLCVILGLGLFTIIFILVAFHSITSGLVWIILVSLLAISTIIGNWPQHLKYNSTWWKNTREDPIKLMVGSAIAFVFVVIIAQATYYPFTGDDEISRYAYYARLMYERGELTSAIRGYPPLLPAIYASNFFAAGQIVEQVAKLYPVIISAMTILVTYGLARYWFGKRAGYTAALILSSTPLFIHWSPVGYVDIATGLCFATCAFTVEIWRRTQQTNWAIVTGMVAGIGIWTKQAGFAIIGPLAIICIQMLVKNHNSGSKRYSRFLPNHVIVIFFTAILVGGWWYIRNAYYDGWASAVPSAGLYHIMNATNAPEQIVPFIGRFSEFGLATSPIYIAGLIWAFCTFKNQTIQRILLWCVPYTLLWWWRFSFDPRFLLSILPFYAILAGGAFDAILSRIRFKLYPKLSSLILLNSIIVITAIGLYQSRLGGIIQWVTNPQASYTERVYRAKGDLYHTVQYLLDNSNSETLIYSTDGRLRYYLVNYDISVGYPNIHDLQDHDLFVVGSRAQLVYDSTSQKDSNPYIYLNDSKKFKLLCTGRHHKMAIYKILTN